MSSFKEGVLSSFLPSWEVRDVFWVIAVFRDVDLFAPCKIASDLGIIPSVFEENFSSGHGGSGRTGTVGMRELEPGVRLVLSHCVADHGGGFTATVRRDPRRCTRPAVGHLAHCSHDGAVGQALPGASAQLALPGTALSTSEKSLSTPQISYRFGTRVFKIPLCLAKISA